MTDAIGSIQEVVADCRDPVSLAAFWAAVLGAEPVIRDVTWATVRDPATGVVIAFQQVPEPKRGTNRLHHDLEVPELGPATAACVALGAEAGGPVARDNRDRSR